MACWTSAEHTKLFNSCRYPSRQMKPVLDLAFLIGDLLSAPFHQSGVLSLQNTHWSQWREFTVPLWPEKLSFCSRFCLLLLSGSFCFTLASRTTVLLSTAISPYLASAWLNNNCKSSKSSEWLQRILTYISTVEISEVHSFWSQRQKRGWHNQKGSFQLNVLELHIFETVY